MADGTQLSLLSIDEAVSAQKSKSNSKRTKEKQKALAKQGEQQEYAYAFKYIDGRVVTVAASAKAILALGLPVIMQDSAIKMKKNSRGSGVHAEVVRTVLSKPLRYSLVSRVNQKTKKYTREWNTIAIPKDAKVLDILSNITNWSVKPEMVRINGQNILTKEPKGAAFRAASRKAKNLAKTKALLPAKKAA
jgi:hypothetical protein